MIRSSRFDGGGGGREEAKSVVVFFGGEKRKKKKRWGEWWCGIRCGCRRNWYGHTPPLGWGGGVCVYIGGADLGVDAGLCFG